MLLIYISVCREGPTCEVVEGKTGKLMFEAMDKVNSVMIVDGLTPLELQKNIILVSLPNRTVINVSLTLQ